MCKGIKELTRTTSGCMASIVVMACVDSLISGHVNNLVNKNYRALACTQAAI